MDYKIFNNHTVVATTMYHGNELCAYAKAGHDNFNMEFGKALARARLEMEICGMNETNLLTTRYALLHMSRENYYDAKFIRYAIEELDERLKTVIWRRRLQSMIVRIIKETNPAVCEGFTMREIILNAREKALELVPKSRFK